MEEFKKLPPPFKQDGTPSKYLRMILPFFEQERSTKKQMLKNMGIDLNVNPDKRNSHSSTFAELRRAEILRTVPRGDGTWYRGTNWDKFLTYVVQNLMAHKHNRAKFYDLLIKYDSNSIDFIMKD